VSVVWEETLRCMWCSVNETLLAASVSYRACPPSVAATRRRRRAAVGTLLQPPPARADWGGRTGVATLSDVSACAGRRS